MSGWGKKRLNNRIVDKHVIIPDGEVIGFDPVMEREQFIVTDKGIIVIPGDFIFQ